MGWMIVLGAMAAFGAICILRVLFGWMLPGFEDGILLITVSAGIPESFSIRRYVYLKELGLLNCTMLAVDLGLSETERKWLLQQNCGIEIVDPEDLNGWLELERNRIDRTGNGDHSGRDQRRGVSEL